MLAKCAILDVAKEFGDADKEIRATPSLPHQSLSGRKCNRREAVAVSGTEADTIGGRAGK